MHIQFDPIDPYVAIGSRQSSLRLAPSAMRGSLEQMLAQAGQNVQPQSRIGSHAVDYA